MSSVSSVVKFLIALIFSILAVAAAATTAAAQTPSEPTFNRDIAPLIWTRCGSCHRPGAIAPFSLIEYRDVRSRARQILTATKNHTMPPWLPEPGHGEFTDARRLSDADVRRIEQWVDGGAREGRAADLPPQPVWNDGWQLGTPDLVVEAPDAVTLPPGTSDVFRNLVIPVPLDVARYVRGVEVDPGNRRVVHHASLAVDRSHASRLLDAADPGPGFSGGMFSESARSPESRALGWTPGMTPAFEAPGMAWRIEKGSDLVLLLHLMPSRSGVTETVRPRVALYFATDPPTRAPIDFKLGSKAIDIPAGAASYTIEDHYTVPVDVDLLSIYPHAHYLAREMKVTAAVPGGATTDLIWIRNWDFQWQEQYRYRDPRVLPRGTVITMRYTYDNSAANKHNPAAAPGRVVYGPQSSDEMGDVWLRFLPHSPADAETLAKSYRQHELQNDLVLGEQMVAAFPAEPRWRNALGAAYIQAGRVTDAVSQLREAIRLAPDHVEAHNNLGHALQLQEKFAESVAQFREAVRLAPSNDLVHLNLANALEETGDLAEAITEFQKGLALNPVLPDAHNNLGVALAALGRIDEAMVQFEAALDLQPDYVDAQNNLLLARQVRGR